MADVIILREKSVQQLASGWIEEVSSRREKRERETDRQERGLDWDWYVYGMVPQSGFMHEYSLAGNVGVSNRSGKVNQHRVRYVM